MIVAKTQTFFSHIHRNSSLTTVWGHRSEKTLSSCPTVLGDPVEKQVRSQSCQSPSQLDGCHWKQKCDFITWLQEEVSQQQMETIYKTDPTEEAPLSWWGECSPLARLPSGVGERRGKREAKPIFFFFLVENLAWFLPELQHNRCKLELSPLAMKKRLNPSNHPQTSTNKTITHCDSSHSWNIPLKAHLTCTQKSTKLLFGGGRIFFFFFYKLF